LQPHDDDRDTRLSSLAGAHRPLRVCIYCNGDRHFKVMRNALLTTRVVFCQGHVLIGHWNWVNLLICYTATRSRPASLTSPTKTKAMSPALRYWMGGAHHCSGPLVSEMTYTVSSGTLNHSIPLPYHHIQIPTYNYNFTSLRRPFDCLSEVIKVTQRRYPLAAVTLIYLFIYLFIYLCHSRAAHTHRL